MIKSIYTGMMKHLDEFNQFKWLSRPAKTTKNVLIISTDRSEAKILVVGDVKKFLEGQGVEVKTPRTALEDENYELECSKRLDIQELVTLLPELPASDSIASAKISMWWADAPDEACEAIWNWGSGIYKSNSLAPTGQFNEPVI